MISATPPAAIPARAVATTTPRSTPPAGIPQPRPGLLMPTVSIPATPSLLPSKYDMSINGLREEGPLRELADTVTGSLPDWFRDPMYNKVVKQINRFIFTSRPGDPPQPVDPTSWHFSVIGDMGNGTAAQRDVASNLLANKPELVLTVGDNVYPDSRAANWQKHFDPPELMGDIMRAAPVLPVVGNHDIKPDPSEYFNRFPWLKGARYYSADFKNVHVVSLDTNDSLAPDSPQGRWLAEDLAKSTAPWKIVTIHHPMMSVISKVHYRHTSKLPEYLGPAFAKHGVDLVLAGHEHFYERSKPLNDAGTIQVTAGGGGGALYPFPYPQTSWSQTRDLDFGHVNFEVRGDDQLVGRYVKRDGTVGDTFVLRNVPAVADAVGGADAVQAAGASAS